MTVPMQLTAEPLCRGYQFTEGLRWHEGYLWFCDLWAQRVYCCTASGDSVNSIKVDDSPAGLGWLSDGRLLITSLYKRQLLQFSDGVLSLYADLSLADPGYCHDFTVSPQDTIYLSASGFYPGHGVTPVTSNVLAMLPGDTKPHIATSGVSYPNGIVITPDGKHLFVAETFAARISLYDIDQATGALCNHQVWAAMDDLGFQVSFDENGIPENLDRHYPDGICYDPVLDGVWFASPGRNEVVCVARGGTVITTVATHARPFDCILGGADERTLFIASSNMSRDEATGMIEILKL